MGGIGYTLDYRRSDLSAAWDPEAFLRDVWRRIDTGIRARAKSKAAKDIVTIYLADTAADGLRDGLWFAGPSEMMLCFGDAAGLCTREMHVSRHYVSVIALDAFQDLERIASKHGAALLVPDAKPGEDADGVLRRLLSEGQRGVAFTTRARVVWALADPNASPATLLPLGDDGDLPVGKVPAKDREWVLERIRRGVCGCEVCESLRAERGLPTTPKPAPAPKKQASPKSSAPATAKERPAPAFGVLDAPLQLWPDMATIRAAASTMVAVDLNASHVRKKPPVSLFRALEACPLRALMLRGQGMRALWPEVTRYPELEILSLNRCKLGAPIGSALMALPMLRALDLRDNHAQQVFESLELPREAEVVDVRAKSPDVLERLVRLPRLRTLDVSAGRIPELAYERPIDTLWLGHGVEFDEAGLRALPLRFVSSWNPSLFAGTSVEHFALPFSGLREVPEGLRSLRNVRALYLQDNLTSLPDWLAELPHLTTLFVRVAAADTNPSAFRVLERMTNLRVLVIRAGEAAALPLDLSALKELRIFALHDTYIRELAGLPRGLDSIVTLRAVLVGGQVPYDLVQQWRASVPSARYDIATFADGEPLDHYRMSLPRATYDHFLSRCSGMRYTDLLVAP